MKAFDLQSLVVCQHVPTGQICPDCFGPWFDAVLAYAAHLSCVAPEPFDRCQAFLTGRVHLKQMHEGFGRALRAGMYKAEQSNHSELACRLLY